MFILCIHTSAFSAVQRDVQSRQKGETSTGVVRVPTQQVVTAGSAKTPRSAGRVKGLRTFASAPCQVVAEAAFQILGGRSFENPQCFLSVPGFFTGAVHSAALSISKTAPPKQRLKAAPELENETP